MKQIKLPTYPTVELPDNMEVRDYDLEDGRYVRVIMEIDPMVVAEHHIMTCQVYEMTAEGFFKAAPFGFPSRTKVSQHTIHRDDLGDTMELDDDWCRFTGHVDQMMNPLPTVEGKPTQPGTEYGEKVWDSLNGFAWCWKKGFADTVAEGKIREMKSVMQTSLIRSGLGFKALREKASSGNSST